MKIGICTIHFPYNYGAMLQAYAFAEYLRRRGHCAEIIDYRPYCIDKNDRIYWRDIVKHPKSFLRKLKGTVCGMRRYTRGFEDFLAHDMPKSHRVKDKRDIDYSQYDYIFSGSDQVWNPQIVGGDLGYYLLEDVSCEKGSFASSIGIDSLTSEMAVRFRKALSAFDLVTVREESAVQLLSDCGIDAKKVVDPVFLFRSQEWGEFARPVPVPDDKYLLYYSLGGDPELDDCVSTLKKEYHLPVYSIHPYAGDVQVADLNVSREYSVGPREFVWLIQHAEMICSDSFHANAFSILFGKTFVPFIHKQTGTRVRNLLQQFSVDITPHGNDRYAVCSLSGESERKMEELIDFSARLLGNVCPDEVNGIG